MIAELRARHRRLWVAIALIIPVLALAAWRIRRPTVVMDQLPPQLVTKP